MTSRNEGLVDLLVMIEPAPPERRLAEITSRLEAMGGTILLTLAEPGLMSVRIDRSSVSDVERLDGVLSVEESRPWQLLN